LLSTDWFQDGLERDLHKQKWLVSQYKTISTTGGIDKPKSLK